MMTYVSSCKYYESYMFRQLEKSCATIQRESMGYIIPSNTAYQYCTIFWPRHSTCAATFKHLVWSQLHCMGSSITAVQKQDFCRDVLISVNRNGGNGLGHFAINLVLIQIAKTAPWVIRLHPWTTSHVINIKQPLQGILGRSDVQLTDATKRHGSKFVHASLVQHPQWQQSGACVLAGIASARAFAEQHALYYRHSPACKIKCMYKCSFEHFFKVTIQNKIRKVVKCFLPLHTPPSSLTYSIIFLSSSSFSTASLLQLPSDPWPPWVSTIGDTWEVETGNWQVDFKGLPSYSSGLGNIYCKFPMRSKYFQTHITGFIWTTAIKHLLLDLWFVWGSCLFFGCKITHTSHLQGVLARNQVGQDMLLFLLPFAYTYMCSNFLPWIGKRRGRDTAPCVLDLCHGGQCWSSLDKSSANRAKLGCLAHWTGNLKQQIINQSIWSSNSQNLHSQLFCKLTSTSICFAANIILLETSSIITCTESWS